MGRPTLYQDTYPKTAFKLALLTLTDEEMAEFFEVTVSTLNRWKLEYPDFCASIKAGKVEADATVALSLYERATGAEWTEEQVVKIKTGKDTETVEVVTLKKQAPPDTSAATRWLYNRQPQKWRDRGAGEDVPGDTSITIVINGGPPDAATD
jgi:hypothetical protein